MAYPGLFDLVLEGEVLEISDGSLIGDHVVGGEEEAVAQQGVEVGTSSMMPFASCSFRT